MSRSNPTDTTPNPAVRWFEWDGMKGKVRFYDKEAENKDSEKKGAQVEVKDGFTFMLLDETSTIKGWNDPEQCGVGSNEVRDTRQEAFVVRLFNKARTRVAEGPYQLIRDRIMAAGGHFTTTCYIAFKPSKEAPVAIAAIQFKGAALRAWMDFKKKNRKDLYAKAVQIKGFQEGKKGSITFRVPQFFIKDVSEETNAQALELDKQLQAYLEGYFKRTKSVASVTPPGEERGTASEDEMPPDMPDDPGTPPEVDEPAPSDDVPF